MSMTRARADQISLRDTAGYFSLDDAESALQSLGAILNSAAGNGAGKVPFSPSAIPAAANFVDWGIRTSALGANVYVCTTGGTSGATAPTGTGTGISDGVCVWDFLETRIVTSAMANL